MSTILSILHILTSTSWGGLELYVCTLIVELKRAGWNPIVVCVPGSRTENFLREHDVEVHASTGGGYANLHDIFLLCRVMQKRRVIAVHSHTRFDIWPASLACRLFPRVRLVHSVYMNVAQKRDWLHRFIYRRANVVLSSSELINREIRERYPIDPSRVQLLRYGIDLSPYINDTASREMLRASLEISPDEILIGMMGRIDVQKGVIEFVESFMQLPDTIRPRIKYLLIGEPTLVRTRDDGSAEYEPDSAGCEERMAAFITKNNLEKNILRRGFQREFVPWLNAMDVFVLPSYAETYSLSVLNAMAMGLPVIGTQSGGTPEQVIDGVRGTLIPPRDSIAIARAVEKYLHHPETRAAQGAAGRQFVHEEHDMEKTISRLGKMYRGENENIG